MLKLITNLTVVTSLWCSFGHAASLSNGELVDLTRQLNLADVLDIAKEMASTTQAGSNTEQTIENIKTSASSIILTVPKRLLGIDLSPLLSGQQLSEADLAKLQDAIASLRTKLPKVIALLSSPDFPNDILPKIKAVIYGVKIFGLTVFTGLNDRIKADPAGPSVIAALEGLYNFAQSNPADMKTIGTAMSSILSEVLTVLKQADFDNVKSMSSVKIGAAVLTFMNLFQSAVNKAMPAINSVVPKHEAEFMDLFYKMKAAQLTPAILQKMSEQLKEIQSKSDLELSFI